MVAELGSTLGGEMGHLLTEMVRTVSFRITAVIQETDLDEDEIPGILKHLTDLSLITQPVGAGGEINEQREGEVRELARREAKEDAARVAGRTAKRKGIRSETAEAVKREILGILEVAKNSAATA